MANTVDKVLKIAEAEVGYLEKKSNSQLDSKTANAGSANYTKYWRDLNATGYQGQPWCNAWVNWVFVNACGEKEAKNLLCTAGAWSYYTPTSAGYFKSKNQWFTVGKKGDIIYFKDSKGGICHVGIVYKVDANYIYTYEGNTSGGSTLVANGGGVAAKRYPKNYARIAGYGRPKYDVAETKIAPVEQKSATTTSAPKTETKTTANTKNKTSKPAVAKPTLKKGSKGDEVKKLQKDLNYVMKCKLAVDGDFGDDTVKQFKAFQNKYKLTVDGVYGTGSQSAMKKALK